MAQHSDPQLSRYISLAHAFPPLTREEEAALAERFRTRADPAARTALINAHLRYVIAIAIKYRRYRVPLDELVSEGNIGLVHALSKFDPAHGTRFVTYASYWIRAHVLNHIIRSWSLISGSGALRSKMFFKLRRERARIATRVADEDRAEALLAEALSLPRAKVSDMLQRLDARDVSLDAPRAGEAGATLTDRLEAGGASPEETLAQQEAAAQVRGVLAGALADLDARERYIVENRLLVDGEDELSLAEVGRSLGVSRERARQLETRTKRKLRERMERALGEQPLPLAG